MTRPTTLARIHARAVRQRNAPYCLRFTGCTTPAGHGVIRHNGKGNQRVHRIVWADRHGTIPAGHIILQDCGHRDCVELAHLRLGTPEDHVAIRQDNNRQALGEAQGSAKLTNVTVMEIVKRLRTGEETLAEIAASYGVHRTAIGFVKRGLTWSHVTGIERATR